MSFHVVIPARFASTRLPGKPLLKIRGTPMIRLVADVCEQSRAASVTIATDHQEIVDLFAEAGKTSALMTKQSHASGTDRVAEVARLKGWSENTIVVNVQGDEPKIPPQLIDQVAELLGDDAEADIATLCTPIASLVEFLDPNVVKVTMTDSGRALYFSRAPIPWNRDTAASLATQREFPDSFRHLGVYAYRVGALFKMTNLAVSSLEQIEKLEQLRALQNSMRIAVACAIKVPGPGIDTEEDLERARNAP
jgi:3-deoxy-manno-octulosonate cytidylyltransferase (CMP-KDO synthetase)